jgi:tyrosyl-tRNA synthetase
MSRYCSALVRELVERGFIHQATDLEALDQAAAGGRITGYVGFDCTADSLHIGHQLSVMLLRRLQQTGHRPIALIGGGTTKVGDPSGKDESRQLLDGQTIARNIEGVKRSLDGFLEFGSGAGQALLVNNAEWLDELRYIDFLRDYGRHFTVNRMLTFDSVRLRLEREQPLSFLEFNYMVMQAYDFVELARRYDCRLQAGGSDQWGNIVNGVELARRTDGLALFGLTTPLITTASGAKMGKTAQGAIWLNEDRLPGFDYWQYWRNTEDADVGSFLRLFTELPLSEIERLERLQGAELNEAKKILANEATRLCRGEEAAASAAEGARAVFEASDADRGGLPTLQIGRAEIEQGLSVVELLRRSGLAASNSEARRLIRGGGARLNDRRIEDEAVTVGPSDFEDGEIRLSAGRKRHARVRVA